MRASRLLATGVIGVAVAILVAVLATTGTGGNRGSLQPPSIEIDELSIYDRNHPRGHLDREFTMMFNNPNDQPLTINTLRYDLYANDKLIGHSSSMPPKNF